MRKLFAVLFMAVLAALTLAIPALAATPPVFPNNIVVFPERDFLALEGYEDKAGQTVNIKVERRVSGQFVTTSTASGTVGAGDPSLEVNHPGGVCWQGVTPNIKPGDRVTATFDDGQSDSTTTLNVSVIPGASGTGAQKVGSNQLIINGRVGANVNKEFMEQRIVNPDLKDTAVGRRDVRAPARPGPYISTLTFPTNTTFRATYTFRDNTSTPNVNEGTQMRDIAAEGQMRVLAWQGEDADANRRGLTIYEFGEVGGPGMGGCPNGPEASVPNAPTNVAATAGDASATATWKAATVIPDATPISGYRVTAVNQATSIETSISVGSTATSATVPDLVNGQSYRIEVRAINAAGAGAPGTSDPVTPQSTNPVPSAPTIGTAVSGLPEPDDTVITAQANWTAATQPPGVTIDGYRVTAYNVNADGSTGARIKSVFADEPASSKEVTFATGGQVQFEVRAIDADGTLSAPSEKSNAVTAQ